MARYTFTQARRGSTLLRVADHVLRLRRGAIRSRRNEAMLHLLTLLYEGPGRHRLQPRSLRTSLDRQLAFADVIVVVPHTCARLHLFVSPSCQRHCHRSKQLFTAARGCWKAHLMEPSLPAENGSAEVSDQDREHAEQAKARGNDAFAGVPHRCSRPKTCCMHRAMCCQDRHASLSVCRTLGDACLLANMPLLCSAIVI